MSRCHRHGDTTSRIGSGARVRQYGKLTFIATPASRSVDRGTPVAHPAMTIGQLWPEQTTVKPPHVSLHRSAIRFVPRRSSASPTRPARARRRRHFPLLRSAALSPLNDLLPFRDSGFRRGSGRARFCDSALRIRVSVLRFRNSLVRFGDSLLRSRDVFLPSVIHTSRVVNRQTRVVIRSTRVVNRSTRVGSRQTPCLTRSTRVVNRSTRVGNRRTPRLTRSMRGRTGFLRVMAVVTHRLTGSTPGVSDPRRALRHCGASGCKPRTVGSRLHTR